MILIALGSNLAGAHGPPRANIEAALRLIAAENIRIKAQSRWYRSPPWPPSDQPWYVNGVIAVETPLAPEALLARLHSVESTLGRVRGVRNAARVIDLDLIDYDGLVRQGGPDLPHPRLADRAFVLLPLADVAPDWVHPKTGQSIKDLLGALPPDHGTVPLEA